MSLKILGFICVIVGCGSCGFSLAAQHLQRINFLRDMISAVEYMISEIRYHCTPLPQLCSQAANMHNGRVFDVLVCLSEELSKQNEENAQSCMRCVLEKMKELDPWYQNLLWEFGRNLGKFDLAGQMNGLESTHRKLLVELENLMENKDNRMRSYQTLGLCAGAAVAILFV